MAETPHKVNSLSISNVNIVNRDEDPRIFGNSSPVGSLYIRTNGEIYQKFDNGNTNWELVFPKEAKNITADYTILRANSNFTVDSSFGNLVLTLPDVTTLYKGKEYYFKKTSSSNSVTISAFSGQTIDGNSSKILNSLNESVILIYIDENNWTTKSSGTSSNPITSLNLTSIKTSNYNAVVNDLVLINTSGGQFTITLPNGTVGDRIAIKDVGGNLNDINKRLFIDPNGLTIDYSVATIELTDNFTYIEFLYNESNNWITVNKAIPNQSEFNQTNFKIYKNGIADYLTFELFDNQQLNIKSPNITNGNYKLGNIPQFSISESYSPEDYVEYNYDVYKCLNNHFGAWNYDNFSLISNRSKIEVIVYQVSHGFTFGNLVKFSSTWQKAQSNALTNYCLGIVSEVIDADNFKLCFSGYLSGFSGLTVNTLYYLSETSAGDYTNVKSDILKQPVFFSISTTDAIILPWSPSLEDFLQNVEYIISNNGVLSFTNKSGIYKLIEKNNVLNELDIKYSIGNSFVDLTIKNMSSLFSNTKDTSGKINIYVETSSVKIQNLSGFMKTFVIKKII